MTPTNSSFVSREDLQCNWHDLPKFDIEPVEIVNKQTTVNREVVQDGMGGSSNKPMNLSSLFMHQVGMKLNQYKTLISRKNSRKNLSNVASFVSVGEAAKDPGTSISRQTSERRKRQQEGISTVKKITFS